MTVREFFEKNPNAATRTIWAADAHGGFGKKGWPVYGNCNDLSVVRVEWHDEAQTHATLHVWNHEWGEAK